MCITWKPCESSLFVHTYINRLIAHSHRCCQLTDRHMMFRLRQDRVALQSDCETVSRALCSVPLPLQRRLCNLLLPDSCLWTTGCGLWGSLIAYCPARNVSSLSTFPVGQKYVEFPPRGFHREWICTPSRVGAFRQMTNVCVLFQISSTLLWLFLTGEGFKLNDTCLMLFSSFVFF